MVDRHRSRSMDCALRVYPLDGVHEFLALHPDARKNAPLPAEDHPREENKGFGSRGESISGSCRIAGTGEKRPGAPGELRQRLKYSEKRTRKVFN
jgi:hypothetical protein